VSNFIIHINYLVRGIIKAYKITKNISTANENQSNHNLLY